MAVDFASKQRDRAGEGWGLRNAKLRMSRKLLFASGLLVCFGCNLDTTLQEKISTEESDTKLNLVNHLREQVRLEILADAVERYGVSNTVARELFGAYAEFLNVLNDKKSREALEKLRAADSRTDPTFKHVREISEELNTLSTTPFSRTPNWHLSQENTESFDETDRLFHWRAGQERFSQSPADVGRKACTGGGVVSSATRRADSARRAVG
jgi:hypothetical protein